MPTSKLAALRNLSELDFTLDRVKPLLEALGYLGVTYVGGANPPERGRDLVFHEIDNKLMHRKDMAAQVKKGNIGASLADRILGQIDEAFNHPHRDPETGAPRRICRLFIVASGRIRDHVVRRIEVERPLLFPFVMFWTGERILQLEKTVVSSPAQVSKAEELIHRLGIDKLFDDEGFIATISDKVEKMFTQKKLSDLRVTGALPEFLLSLDEVRNRIEVLDISDQKEVLRCLSVLIVTKSNRNYGAEGRYGIQHPKRTRA